MKLIDYMRLCDDGYSEFSDTVYDVVIVCNFDRNMKNVYTEICAALYELVEIKNLFKGAYANGTADFTGFVRRNKDSLAHFVRDNWVDEKQYVLNDGNDDDFEYYWCKEFDNFLAGRYGSSNNKDFLELLQECK